MACAGLGTLVRSKVSKLSGILGDLIEGFKGGHVPGYRYLYQSRSTNTMQCSPALKVSQYECLGVTLHSAVIWFVCAVTSRPSRNNTTQHPDDSRLRSALQVGTLSRESVKLIHAVRSAVEDRPDPSASSQPCDYSGPSTSTTGRMDDGWSSCPTSDSREVAVCGSNGCWVVVRHLGPRTVVCVMESGQEGLLAASEAADKFIQCNYNGLLET